MRDASDDDKALGVVDRIHDPVVANANTVIVSSRKLHAPNGTRIRGEPVDRRSDSRPYGLL